MKTLATNGLSIRPLHIRTVLMIGVSMMGMVLALGACDLNNRDLDAAVRQQAETAEQREPEWSAPPPTASPTWAAHPTSTPSAPSQPPVQPTLQMPPPVPSAAVPPMPLQMPTPAPTPPTVAVDGGIRGVDFVDGFVHHVAGFDLVRVEAGAGGVGEPGTNSRLELRVGDVVYGDLTGNGSEEAAVEIGTTTRHGGYYTRVAVFGVQDGFLVKRGETWAGNQAHGGIASFRIEDRVLKVTTWTSSHGECCPDGVAEAHWGTLGSGEGFWPIAQFAPRSWMSLDNTDEPYTRDLRFRDGSTVAVVEARAETTDRYFGFRATGGQTMEMKLLNGNGVRLRVRNELTQRLIGDVAPGKPLQLRHDGRYTAEMLFDSDTSASSGSQLQSTVEIAIADERTLRAPTWRSIVRSVGAEHPDELHYVEFTSVSAVADKAEINRVVRDFVDSRQALHHERVAACAEPMESSYRLSAVPTLISYDLVSLRFNESAPQCGGDFHSQILSLAVDLNTGKPLLVDQILGSDRAAIERLWRHEAQRLYGGYDDFVLPVDLNFSEASIGTSSLSLAASSSELGLAGTYAVQLHLRFEQLDGLIDSGILMRARSGIGVPTVPQEQGCGC